MTAGDAAPRTSAVGATTPRADRPSAAARVGATVPHPSLPALASLLAGAMLGAERWERPDLIASCAAALGARRRWLGPVVDRVLTAHPRPPADEHRSFTAFIATVPELGDAHRAASRARRPIRIVHRPLPPPEARPNAAASVLPSAADLAALLDLTAPELAWFADTAHWNRRAATRLTHYRAVWRARPGRAPRLLEAPKPRLKELQRVVLREVLPDLPAHPAAHGFVPGRSAVTGAALHVGRAVVVRLDRTSFFAAVTAGRVYGAFRRAGWPEGTAHLLTGLCTVRTGLEGLGRMPPGGDPDERFALRAALAEAHLPQGAPTSPALANLAVARLDARLTGLADAVGATYTRYADDLAFSGDAALARRTGSLVRAVTAIAAEEGHAVNRRKTRIEPAAVRQRVTGVVVNRHTNTPRAEYDRMRAILRDCVRDGVEPHCGGDRVAYRAHLLGRIGWIGSCNPARGRALRVALEAIDWTR